jgi:hypothetical protein
MKLRLAPIFIFTFGCVGLTLNGQEISPMLVGTNVWYGDGSSPTTQVWDLTKACGMGSIRIGGHAYDDNMPTNAQLNIWVKKIQAMGAQPIIQVSQYGAIATIAANAAATVKYFNIDLMSGKPVKYWNIGNEPILQAGWPSASTFGATVEAYYKPIAAAMKAVDSTIKIFGPDECDYNNAYYPDLFGGKNDITGKIPGKSYYYCDGLSWHRYPQGTGDPATEGAADMLLRVHQAKNMVDTVNKRKNRSGDEALQWGIGEFNSKSGSSVHTWGNGQMFGQLLGACMKYDATYATTWSMFESGGNRGGTDFSMIDGNMKPRASYWHMQMIAKNFKGTYANGTSGSANIITFGSKNADTISVMIMNLVAGNPVKYTLHLNDTATSTNGVKLNIDAESKIVYIDSIPGKATQLLIFKGGQIIKTIYTSDDFDKGNPPFTFEIFPAKNVPSAPTALTDSTLSFKSIKLKWTSIPTDTIMGFIIERKVLGSVNFEFIKMISSSVNQFIDDNLADTTSYIYRVQAFNLAGKSAYSITDTAITLKLYRKAFKPHKIPGIIQAEDFDANDEGAGYHDTTPGNADPNNSNYRPGTSVDLQTCTDIGGGYNVGWVAKGEWLDYLIDTIVDGTYDIAFRTASAVTNLNVVKIYLGDKLLGTLNPPNTGSWTTWKTIILNNVEITGGNGQILQLYFDGLDFNVNWVEIGKNLVGVNNVKLDNDFANIFPNPTYDIINIELSSPDGQANYFISNLLGKTVCEGVLANGNNQVDISKLEKGIYIINIRTNKSGTMVKNIIKF